MAVTMGVTEAVRVIPTPHAATRISRASSSVGFRAAALLALALVLALSLVLVLVLV